MFCIKIDNEKCIAELLIRKWQLSAPRTLNKIQKDLQIF